MALANVLARCLTHWNAQGVALDPPIPEAEIRRAWAALGLKPSAEVFEFYGTFGGFSQQATADEFLFQMWPFSRLTAAHQQSPPIGMMFCDLLIHSTVWQLRLEGADHSSVWIDDLFVAPTLEKCPELYLRDPNGIQVANWAS